MGHKHSWKPIYSITLDETLDGVDDSFIHHGERVAELKPPKLIRVWGSSVLYQTHSSHYDQTNVIYNQRILFKDFVYLAKDMEISIEEAINYAINEADIHVSCDCPAYLYWGYKYQTTNLGLMYGPGEYRYPKRRNPQLRGIICKHLDVVLQNIKEDPQSLISKFTALYREAK